MNASIGARRLLRVTLVLSEVLEQRVISQASALGVEGYVCSYCSGKPLHTGVEATRAVHGLVRIELLVREEVADGFLSFLDELQHQAYPVTALLDHVQVYNEGRSFGLVGSGVGPGPGNGATPVGFAVPNTG